MRIGTDPGAGSGGFDMGATLPTPPPPDNNDAFALLPSWNDSVIGVKAFTYFPNPSDDAKRAEILMGRRSGPPGR